MRHFYRKPIGCRSCGAKIYNWTGFRNPEEHDAQNDVEADWGEPPKAIESCPRCGSQVDTTASYPYIPGFPPTFELLQKAHEHFTPQWEAHRRSFEQEAADFLKSNSLKDFEAYLNSAEGLAWFKQRMFYRSATAFYRSLQLFLAYPHSRPPLLCFVGRGHGVLLTLLLYSSLSKLASLHPCIYPRKGFHFL